MAELEKPKRARQKPSDRNYVNNKEFTLALDKYARACAKARAEERDEPKMPNYVGECIMKMAERLSLTPRFRGYPFREDAVGNSIIAAVKYAKNFNGDKYDNGFAYVTQILFSHMIITIKKEKQKYQTSLAMIQQAQLSVFGDQEFTAEMQSHSQMIADQKLKQQEEDAKDTTGAKKGFTLRSGFTAEERAAAKGTPLQRESDE